jgi:hypothetical protein
LVFCVSSISAREDSDREKSGFRGYVKSVRQYTQEIDSENGRLNGTKAALNSVEVFDVSGRRISYASYSDGKILYKNSLIYSAQGKLMEVRTIHSENLYLCDKKTYLYNEFGKLAEEQCFIENGKIVGKRIYNYDEKGYFLEEKSISMEEKSKYFNNYVTRRKFDDKGREIERATVKKVGDEWQPEDFRSGFYKWIFFYDSRGNIVRRHQIKADESIFGISESFYDEKGNEIETIEFNTDGTLKDRQFYQYEFDNLGNYVKEIAYEWVSENGKTFFQPSEITYRKIEYHSEKETAKYRAKFAK